MRLLDLVAALAAATAQASDRSPPPGPEEMLAALFEEAPGAEVAEVVHHQRRIGSDVIFTCGTARIAGQVEPFAVMARWQDPRNRVTYIPPGGAPVPTPPRPEWRVLTSVPLHSDRDGDGSVGADDRNRDAVARRLALTFCPNLHAPDGVTWNTDTEPRPAAVRGD